MTTKVNRDEDPMSVAQSIGLPVERRLAGAYVQAWVWVDLASTPDASREDILLIARKQYEGRQLSMDLDGEIEIDPDAEVSLSYEGG